MRIAILGATGCIGSSLIKRLVAGDDSIIAFYRTNKGLEGVNIEWVKYDLCSDVKLETFLKNVDILYYLVHSLDESGFSQKEDEYASKANQACQASGCNRIVYLGGIISGQHPLSEHLRSRKVTGETLSNGGVNVLEFRASIVLAECSTSYHIIRRLAERLPFMVVPRWLNSKCSPIYIEDLMDVFLKARRLLISGHQITNLGADTLTYRELLMETRRASTGKSLIILPLPFIALRLSSYWLWLIARVNLKIARNLTVSLVNDMVTEPDSLRSLLGREPTSVAESLQLLAKPNSG